MVGGTMANAEHEPITGVWEHSPQRGPEAEPLVRGSGGEAPLKLKAFWSLGVQRSRQFSPFPKMSFRTSLHATKCLTTFDALPLQVVIASTAATFT